MVLSEKKVKKAEKRPFIFGQNVEISATVEVTDAIAMCTKGTLCLGAKWDR